MRKNALRAATIALLVASGGPIAATGQDAPPAAPPAAPPPGAAATARTWRTEAIRGEAGGPSAPEAMRTLEPFAALLANDGLRVVAPDGKVRLELWWRAELPLLPNSVDGNFTLGRLTPGSFVGVARMPGGTHDYRDQPIDAGVYALRYFHQPSDANHLGTSDSRDFLVLTSLAEERSPEPVATKEALLALAVPISPSDHALVLYVTAASEPAPADGLPRIVKRGELDEQALECALPARAAAAPGSPSPPTETLRLALVVDGHTAH